MQLEPGETFNPWREACGFYVPDVIGRLRSLTDGQKRLYERLVRYAGRDGHCYPSQQRLAEDLGKSDRQIRRDLEKLEELRFIGHSFREGRRSNTYVFLWHEAIENQGKIASADPATDDLTGQPCPLNETTERTSTSGQKPQPDDLTGHLRPVKDAAVHYDPGFERTSTSGLSGHPRPTNSVQEKHTLSQSVSKVQRAGESDVPAKSLRLGRLELLPERSRPGMEPVTVRSEGGGFQEFQSQYPEPKRNVKIESGCRAYIGRIHGTPGEHRRLMEGLARYNASADWQRALSQSGGRFIPSMERFIGDGMYLDHPPAAEEASDGYDGYLDASDPAVMAEFRRKELAAQ
jgi:hypothetical protein